MAISKHLQPSVFYGALPMLMDKPRYQHNGLGALDTGTVRALVNDGVSGGWKASLSSLGITEGSKYAGLWVKSITRITLGREVECDVQLEGVFSGDKRQRVISAFGSTVSIGPIEQVILVNDEVGEDPEEGGTGMAKRRVPKVDGSGKVVNLNISTGTGQAERWNIFEPGVTVVDTYYQTSSPDTSANGAKLSPPSAPTAPAYQWGAYNRDMRKNHPSGWVLTAREAEQLYGAVSGGLGLWKVVDTYDYFFAARPE